MEALGSKFLKSSLLFLTAVTFVSTVFLVGCAGFGACIFAISDGRTLNALLGESAKGFTIRVFGTSALILVSGSVGILILSIVGFYGTWKERRPTIALFMVLDATVLLLIIASLGFLKSQGDLTATMEKSLYDTMAKYDPSSGNKKIRSVTGHWDNIQREFKCCGVHDYRDWRNESSYFKDRTSKVPVACCENAATNGLAASIDDCLDKPEKFANDSVMQGCISQFLKAYETAEKLLFYISLGAIVLLVGNLCVSIVVYLRVSNHYQY